MVKLPKSIIAKYGITKKAWQVFRGKKGKSKPKKHTAHARPKRRKAHKKTRVPTGEHQERGEKQMAKKRRKGFRSRARRVGRRIRQGVSTRPGQLMMMAVEAAAGGVVTSMVANKAPIIKDQSKMIKAVAQSALGFAAITFIRNRHVKSLGAGAVIAGVMSLAQDLFKVSPLAGPSAGSRTLRPSEMARLTNGSMGMPLPGMGAPLATAPGNAGFGRGGFGS